MADVKSKVRPFLSQLAQSRRQILAGMRAETSRELPAGCLLMLKNSNANSFSHRIFTSYSVNTIVKPAFPSNILTVVSGNTSDQDSDREPSPPLKTVEKPSGRSGKRDAPKDAPTEPAQSGGRGGRGGRRGGFTGSEEGMSPITSISPLFIPIHAARICSNLCGSHADVLQRSVTATQAALTTATNLPMMASQKIVTLTE